MTKTESHISASRFYLCEELPKDFNELNEQGLMGFIENNKWEPLEQWEPHVIWELIEDLASEFMKISNINRPLIK